MGGITDILRGLDWSILLSVPPILICLTIHELAHGAMALAMGDDTAKQMGRLTLNPIKHIDPIGLLMLLVVRFGWAKPVPVDMRKFRRPKFGMAVVALAGSISNFLLAALILLFQVPIIRLLHGGEGVGYVVADMLMLTARISVFLGVFNLLPVPPLDGSKVVFSILPNAQHNLLMRYERYGFILLIVLMLTGVVMGPLMNVMNAVFRWIIWIMHGPSAFFFM